MAHWLMSVLAAWDQLARLALVPACDGFDLCTCSFEVMLQMLTDPS